MYYVIAPTNQDLLHYGVLGMHWGVRRYQPYSTVPRKSGEGGKEIGDAKKASKDIKKVLNSYSKGYELSEKYSKKSDKYNKKHNKRSIERNKYSEKRYENDKKINSDMKEAAKHLSDTYGRDVVIDILNKSLPEMEKKNNLADIISTIKLRDNMMSKYEFDKYYNVSDNTPLDAGVKENAWLKKRNLKLNF